MENILTSMYLYIKAFNVFSILIKYENLKNSFIKSWNYSKFVMLFLIIPFLFLSLDSQAQKINPNLILSSGGAGDDDSPKITYDNEGNIYCVAVYSESPIFNHTVVSTFGTDNIILSKYNSEGTFLWGKTIVYGYLIGINSLSWENGKLLMSGYFRNSLVFRLTQNEIPDTLAYSGVFYDPFIAEFNEDGTVLNKMSFDYKTVNEITGIKFMGSNVLICGTFENTFCFNQENPNSYNTITSAGESDIFVACLDPDFNLVWAKRMGGPSYDYLYGFEIYKGEIYLTGSFVNKMDFNTPSSESNNVLTAYGYGDIFIAKLDKYGNPKWLKRGGSSSDENYVGESSELGCDLFVNKHGVYLIGAAYNQAHFNGPQDPVFTIFNTSSNSLKHFLALYSHKGSIQWVKELQTEIVFFPPIIHGTDDYIVINEGFRNNLTFYSTYYHDSIRFIPKGYFDHLTRIFDFNGNFVSGASLGSSSNDYVYDLYTSDNQIYVTGSFKDVCFFNDELYPQSFVVSNGSYDIFIARYDVPNFIFDPGETVNYVLKLFPNPAQNQITITNNTEQIGLKYVLYDITGKNIFQGELTQNTNYIDISNLNQGFYFVEVLTKKPTTLKFIKY